MIKVLNDVDSTEVKNYWKVTGTNDETFPYLLIDKWYNPEELEGVWKELDFYQSCPDHHQVRTEDKETLRAVAEAVANLPSPTTTND